MKLTESSTVVAAPDQISSSLGQEAVILQLTQGMYYGLDEVGARIWEMLKEPRSVREIRDSIVAEYDVAPETAARDLIGLLTELARRGLIEVRDGQAP